MDISPESVSAQEANILPEIATKIHAWMKEGIDKEEKTEILKLVPRNIKDIKLIAPKLNEEIAMNLREKNPEIEKKDKFLYHFQDMISACIALQTSNISAIINEEKEPINREEMLQQMSDALKLSCDLWHQFIISRKVNIAPTFNGKTKNVMAKVEPTEWLFGNNVQDLINKVKTADQVGKNLDNLNKRGNFSSKSMRGNNRPNYSLNWASSSGREANQMNKTKGYFVSRTKKFRGQPNYRYQRQYAQSQPVQQQYREPPFHRRS